MNQLNSNEVMLASFTKLLQNINSEYTLSQHTDKLRLELPLKSPLIHELLLFILSQVKLHYFNKKQTDQISTLSKESLELVMKAFINKKVKSTKEHLYIYLIIIVSVLTGIQLTEDIFEKPFIQKLLNSYGVSLTFQDIQQYIEGIKKIVSKQIHFQRGTSFLICQIKPNNKTIILWEKKLGQIINKMDSSKDKSEDSLEGIIHKLCEPIAEKFEELDQKILHLQESNNRYIETIKELSATNKDLVKENEKLMEEHKLSIQMILEENRKERLIQFENFQKQIDKIKSDCERTVKNSFEYKEKLIRRKLIKKVILDLLENNIKYISFSFEKTTNQRIIHINNDIINSKYLELKKMLDILNSEIHFEIPNDDDKDLIIPLDKLTNYIDIDIVKYLGYDNKGEPIKLSGNKDYSIDEIVDSVYNFYKIHNK